MSADFIDSNVFLYLFDEAAPAKRRVATELIYRALVDGNGVISFQVIQETLNIATSKLAEPLTPEDASSFLSEVLAPLWSVLPTLDLYERALQIRDRFRYTFYDSLIVSGALQGRCSRLLSEDLQDGQVIDGLTIVNPFAT